MSYEATIGSEEWEEVIQRLVPFLHPDDRDPLGELRLQVVDGRRSWTASDHFRAAVLTGGTDHGSVVTSVPLRTAVAGAALAAGESSHLLVGDIEDGLREISVSGPAGSTTTLVGDRWYPDVHGFVRQPDPLAELTVAGDHLRRVLHVAAVAAEAPRDDGAALLRILVGAEHDALVIRSDRAGVPDDLLRVPGSGSPFDGYYALNPSWTAEAASLVGHEVVVRFTAHGTLELDDGELVVVIRALESDAEQRHRHVAGVIEEVFGPGATRRDEDGDYVLRSDGSPVFGRLHPVSDPPCLEVFSVLLDGVEGTSDLFAELNDHNANLPFVRVVHRHDQVVASCELVAPTLDPEELVTAFRRVEDAVVRLVPVLSTVFGGRPFDASEERWTTYLDTVISAEVGPGRSVDLTGAEAVADWPFPGTVHVVTAWNPYGLLQSVEQNEADNAALGAALLRAGVRFVPAVGRALDGSHAEPGFVVWGADREAAVAMAREFQQEAIFEIDDHELRLIHCTSGREDRTTRRPG